MANYRKLRVWEKAHRLVLDIYAATERFPPVERFGLVPQLRRTAVSIPSNIAEGCGRRSDGELVRFIAIAHGSALELEYQLLLSRDLGYLGSDQHSTLSQAVAETGRMLNGLSRRVIKTRTTSNSGERRSSANGNKRAARGGPKIPTA